MNWTPLKRIMQRILLRFFFLYFFSKFKFQILSEERKKRLYKSWRLKPEGLRMYENSHFQEGNVLAVLDRLGAFGYFTGCITICWHEDCY